jgi:hypothetical protein
MPEAIAALGAAVFVAPSMWFWGYWQGRKRRPPRRTQVVLGCRR